MIVHDHEVWTGRGSLEKILVMETPWMECGQVVRPELGLG